MKRIFSISVEESFFVEEIFKKYFARAMKPCIFKTKKPRHLQEVH